MRIKKKWIIIFLLPSAVLFCFVYLFSIGQITTTSFADWRIGQPITFNGIKNYAKLLTSDEFWMSIKNTIIWIILQSTIHVTIAVVFAMLMTRGKRYSGFFRTIFMLPNIISGAAMGLLFYHIFNPMYGPINKIIQMCGIKFDINWFANPKTAFWALTMTWIFYAATGAILIIAEIEAIPKDILEASLVDGASEFQMVWYVKLPMVRRAIGTATILAATSMLHKFDVISMTTNGGPGIRTMNMPILIYNTAFKANNLALGNAQSVVLLILGLLTVVLINKLYRMSESI